MKAAGSDALAGAHLGKEYWVIDRIGDGGMGVVYLVEHRGLKKQFAAKVLSRELTESQEARARFEIEARAASQLEHENIVSVTDYGVATDGRPFLVMELLRGKTLYGRMGEGPVSLSESVAIIVPVCAALGAAHEAGIVHRDIKPENIFLATRAGGRFQVKVLDFGIAKANLETQRVTKLGQVLGSPLYMAPEACRGEEVDARADVYSIGVLLYQLAVGRLPFEDANMLKLLQLHASAPVPHPRKLNPELPEAVERVILRTLTKDREVRIQTVEELANLLLAALPPGADALLRTPSLTPLLMRTPSPMSAAQRGSPSRVATVDQAAIGGGPTLMAEPADVRPTVSMTRPSQNQVAVVVDPAVAAAAATAPALTLQTKAAPPRKRALLLVALLLGFAALGLLATTLVGRKEAAPSMAATAGPEPPAPVAAPPVAAVAAPEPVPVPEPTPVPAPARIRVHLTSTPAGAQVRLGEHELGVTPLDTTLDARPGAASLELRHRGYRADVREVPLDRDVELAITLEPEKRGRRERPTRHPAAPAETPTPTPDLEIRGRR